MKLPLQGSSPAWRYLQLNKGSMFNGNKEMDKTRRVYRIGVQTLENKGGVWTISIQNRSYRSEVILTKEQAQHWYNVLSNKIAEVSDE